MFIIEREHHISLRDGDIISVTANEVMRLH